MSILIKGMKMPKSKPICIIIDPAGQVRHYDLNNDKYIDDELLEAVPVLSHEDLIERKAICLTNFEIAMCGGDYKEGMKMLLEKIEAAPTSIPADESDMDSFIHIFEDDDEEDGMDSFIRILKD